MLISRNFIVLKDQFQVETHNQWRAKRLKWIVDVQERIRGQPFGYLDKCREAREDIIKSMEVVCALIQNSTNANERDGHLDNFEYLHSELAALDSQHLGQSGEAYRPLTIRLAHAAKDLEADYEQAKQLAQSLNLTSSALDSMSTLVKALA